MNNDERWRLPDGVEELLPAAALPLENLRRHITDLHSRWGYELVIPPLIEYLDSLLTGSGQVLDLQTFKLVDQLNGKMMGVRADMTPQVARIDSHLLQNDDVSRLFYLGSVLRTMPDAPGGSRSPLQLGAELYGHAGIESDVEIINLMLATVRMAGLESPMLDLGHVGIYRGLVAQAKLSETQEARLFDSLQRKSGPEIDEYLLSLDLCAETRAMFSALSSLSGGLDVLSSARDVLSSASKPVQDALDALDGITRLVARRNTDIQIHIDLSELRGYSYHTGVVFAVYSESHGHELARGGRYDDIGLAFGRKRPATGYSTDLKELMRVVSKPLSRNAEKGIFVTSDIGEDAWDEIERLRATGERVVIQLPGSAITAQGTGCDRRLTMQNNRWLVETI